MDADIFVSGKKKLRIQKYPDTCGRGLRKQTHLQNNVGKVGGSSRSDTDGPDPSAIVSDCERQKKKNA